MVEPFTTFMTTESLDDLGTVTSDYDDDYDTGPTEPSGMCDRSWVRSFHSQYRPPLFWIIFILGAVGNLLVVWIYTTVRNRMKTMTDVYLLNLAMADLLFLCTLPFWAVEATKGWNFGVALCKVVFAVYRINFFSSMLLLTSISVDRYISIVQVTKAQNMKRQRFFWSKVICLGVWMVSILLTIPEFIYATLKTNQNGHPSCTMVYSNNSGNLKKILVLSMQIIMGFCVPLLVMFFCYLVIIHTLLQARNFQKHKALRVVFAVVFVFILSQLPYSGLEILEATQAASVTLSNCQTVIGFDMAREVSRSLAYTHACLNPFLYVFIGVRFRQDLLRMAKACASGLGFGGLSKLPAIPKRPSVLSDTDTTPPLSI